MKTRTRSITPEKAKVTAFNWRLFLTLLGMVAFGLIALIPYELTLAGQTFSWEMTLQLLPQFMAQLVLYGFFIWVGLKLSPRVGLTVQVLKNWLAGKQTDLNAKAVVTMISIGSIAGLGMILLDVYVFAPRLVGETVRPAAWQGFLASSYGGIVEEVMMRFFLMTLLVWIGSKISRNADGDPTSAVFWVAILISGLFFGLGHLPTAVAMGISLTPFYVIRTLVLNGVGIIYGWLYWTRGLESAMLAHFSTDIIVHFLGAFLI